MSHSSEQGRGRIIISHTNIKMERHREGLISYWVSLLPSANNPSPSLCSCPGSPHSLHCECLISAILAQLWYPFHAGTSHFRATFHCLRLGQEKKRGEENETEQSSFHCQPRIAQGYRGPGLPLAIWVLSQPAADWLNPCPLPATARCQTQPSSGAWVNFAVLFISAFAQKLENSEGSTGEWQGGTGTWWSTAPRDLAVQTMVCFIIYLGSLFSSNTFKIGGKPNRGSRVVFPALSLWKQFPLLASSKQK